MIRPERSGEADAIGALTTAAFRDMPYAGGNEAAIVERLRDGGDLLLSLVDDEGGLRGHLAASPATVGGVSGWAALGPVSVHPEDQRRGIGSTLMRAALTRLRDSGSKGAVLAGNPAFYGRFGFEAYTDLTSRGIPPEYVLGLSFGPAPPTGSIVFHDAFRPVK